MKQFLKFLVQHKKGITLSLVLLMVGACFRWEIAEIDDVGTGQWVASHHRVVFPWTPCGASGSGRLVNFHVRHWLCYGLIRIEATGQTM